MMRRATHRNRHPKRSARRPVAQALALAALLLAGCSQRQAPPSAPQFVIKEANIALPKIAGWLPMQELPAVDPQAGGIVFRLVRPGHVAGAPRIDVGLGPQESSPARLEPFLNSSLREMAALENLGQIRITNIERRPTTIGPRNAWHVLHEYVIGKGQDEIAITQSATLFVLDGRGITITASGRTELFHPLATSIDRMLSGVRVLSDPTAAALPAAATPSDSSDAAPAVQPVDLGKIGGN